MTTTAPIMTDNARLTFAVRTAPATYGDDKTVHRYQIPMRAAGKVVGWLEGPRRLYPNATVARNAGWARVSKLKTHHLYVIDITDENIDHGEGRNCQTCAISQALWRNQGRMGISRSAYNFRVEPYDGMGTDAKGITLSGPGGDPVTGLDGMPMIVTQRKRGPVAEDMGEWARVYDEWSDAVTDLDAWRKSNDYDTDEPPPSRPMPCSFVLDLDGMWPAK